jgi:hypothetical protein
MSLLPGVGWPARPVKRSSSTCGADTPLRVQARRLLAERFRAAQDPEQVKQLGDQLGRFVFGE